MENLRELPQPFGFYRYILKSDHLHFGLWGEDGELSMEDAQERMFSRLLSYFPAPPASVLDVGCGLGLSAARLSQLGYKVFAIAPSRELIEYASGQYGESGVEFRVLGFLDEDGDVFASDSYDIVLFQESAQYLGPLDSVMRKTRRILRDKGVVIIGDEVCYDKTVKPFTSVHMSYDFEIALAENGFNILEDEKVGEKVSPTCDFIIDEFTHHFDEIVSCFDAPDTSEKLLFYIEGWKKQKEWYANGQTGYEIFFARKDRFSVRSYSEGDEYQILPTFNALFYVDRSIEHWYWKFRNDPYGSYKISLIYDGDTLAVHYAGYPVPFYSSVTEPETFTTMQIGDTMTIPAVRKIGLGKTGLLARTSRHFYAKYCEGSFPFIYGFNTGQIRKLGTRFLGYSYIDPVILWVKDLAEKPFSAPTLLRRLFSGLKVEEVHSVDDEWTAFFDHVRDSYEFLVLRDARYLQWRYMDCPDKVHRFFAVRKGGRLVGWSVFRVDGTRIIWGDALFDNGCPEAAHFLLYHICSKEFPEARSIEAWFSTQPGWWNVRLQELGFDTAREPDDLTPGFAVFGDPSMLQTIRDHFYYTKGDSDLF